MRLPASLRSVIDDAIGEFWLSPISIWETAMLHARGRIELAGGPRAWVTDALARFPLSEASLTDEVAPRSQELELDHHDPADRVLAATALVHGSTLMTLDERLPAIEYPCEVPTHTPREPLPDWEALLRAAARLQGIPP